MTVRVRVRLCQFAKMFLAVETVSSYLPNVSLLRRKGGSRMYDTIQTIVAKTDEGCCCCCTAVGLPLKAFEFTKSLNDQIRTDRQT